MKTISFSENFLLKYGGLFHTVRLDVFDKYVEKLNQAIRKKYKQRISIYWYIHKKDDKNSLIYANHLQMDSSDIKSTSSLSTHYIKTFKKKYPFIPKDKLLCLSYAIVIHEKPEPEFKCLNPDSEKIEQMHQYNYESFNKNFQTHKDIYNNFLKVEQVSNTTGLNHIISSIYIQLLQNPKKTIIVIVSFLTFLLLIRLTAIPTSSIQYETLSFSITYTLVLFALTLLLSIPVPQILMFPIILFILALLGGKKQQMKAEVYVNTELFLIPSKLVLLVTALILLHSAYFTLFTRGKDMLTDVALTKYLTNTQVPTILKMQYKDMNISKSANVLYLGEEGQNVDFLFDTDLHQDIYKNEDLTKSVCMGKLNSYVSYILPMIYAGTFENKVYRRTRARNISLSAEQLSFQDTFCFLEYPKAIQLKSTDKILLLMGKPNSNNQKDKYYYYDLATVEKKILNQPNLCNVRNENEFIREIMASEVLKNIPYKNQTIPKDTLQSFNLFQKICHKI